MEAAESTPNTRFISSDFGSMSSAALELPKTIPIALESHPALSKEVVPCLGLTSDMAMASIALRTGEVILLRSMNLAASSDK